MSGKSQNEDFDDIMHDITSGLTGDTKADIQYLNQKMQEYKEHPMAKEILRAIGRLLFEILPDENKKDLEKMIDNDARGLDAELDEIRFNIFKKDFQKALKLCQLLVDKVESMNMFQDDQVSEYHTFNELFEVMLYVHLYQPQKDLRHSPIPYSTIYGLYGSLLVEMQRLDDARDVLQKGLRWNPVDFSLTSEYIETFKMRKELEPFFTKTLEAFKIAFRPEDVARCFRNLGYYFVEKELYQEAVTAYLLSNHFEKNTMVQSELYYIEQKTGEPVVNPTYEEMEAIAERYHFPMTADQDVLGVAYTYGKDAFEDQEMDQARYCFTILYNLTDDEKIKLLLDQLPQTEEN